MSESHFQARKAAIIERYENMLSHKNEKSFSDNGIFKRYRNPVLTRDHLPVNWRYDFDERRNPYFMERFSYNSVSHSGAIKMDDRYVLVARIETTSRKSFFAVAESLTGIDNFRFWPRPISLPVVEGKPDLSVGDMHLTKHEDGFIYGLFATTQADLSVVIGVIRTKDLKKWERLSNIAQPMIGVRQMVLFSQFVDGKYAFFVDSSACKGECGLSWVTCSDIANVRIDNEIIVDPVKLLSNNELSNGMSATPIRTDEGWLNLAFGVRATEDGPRRVLYVFLTELERPWVIAYKPAGYLLAPLGAERVGDILNNVSSNGWIVDKDGHVLIYYTSATTRIHVAETCIGKLIAFCKQNMIEVPTSQSLVDDVNALIDSNLQFMR